MDSHLTAQSSTVFRAVHSLIYIFDAESPDLMTSDTLYFLKCLRALRDQNPSSSSSSTSSPSPSPSPAPSGTTTNEEEGPTVFVLLHKMDLVPLEQQATKLAEFEADVTKKAREWGWKGNLQFYGTSIWNETLYKVRLPALSYSFKPSEARLIPAFSDAFLQAWSIVISHLMPSLASLRTHLSSFLTLSAASEIVLFERTTFLVISSVTAGVDGQGEEGAVLDAEWDERRFERISTMVKAFKLGCSCVLVFPVPSSCPSI